MIKTVYAESLRSLMITMRFKGHPLSTGTAFLAEIPSGFVLITNRHNVTGRDQNTGKHLSDTLAEPDEIVIMHNREGKMGEWLARTEPLYRDGSPLWREHPVFGAKADFVALPLTQLDDVKCYPYNLHPTAGSKILVGPAEPVSVIGFPFGSSAQGFPIWATGFLASELSVDFNNLPVLLVDCRTRPGQSGSPVIAFRNGGTIGMDNGGSVLATGPMHRFMGIYSGRINRESDIGMVWKVWAIRELVDTFNPPQPTYRPGGVIVPTSNIG